MKKLFLTSIITLCVVFGAFSQSTIHLLYDYPHAMFPIPVKIDNQEVFTLYAKQKKECILYTEGKVLISFDVLCIDPINKPPVYRYQWADEIQLTLSKNSVHYIRIRNKSLTDVKFEELSEEQGKKEFAKKKIKATANYEGKYIENSSEQGKSKSSKTPVAEP